MAPATIPVADAAPVVVVPSDGVARGAVVSASIDEVPGGIVASPCTEMCAVLVDIDPGVVSATDDVIVDDGVLIVSVLDVERGDRTEGEETDGDATDDETELGKEGEVVETTFDTEEVELDGDVLKVGTIDELVRLELKLG